MLADLLRLSRRPLGGIIVAGTAVTLLCLALLAVGHRPPPPPPAAGAPGRMLAVPANGAYTGAYIDFGETEDNVTLEAIEGFEDLVGKRQAIIASSSFWGEQTFPEAALRVVDAHGSTPLVFWSPWDKPYREELVLANGPDRFNLNAILAGRWNAYIDQWADGARAFGRPMFVSLCNEMNGNWFPWSASYYGADKTAPGSNPPRYAGPELFRRAYRYIVDRVRARGAGNILWVFHLNNFSEPFEKWTAFAQYYPGADYVDWLGLSVYGALAPDAKWEDFTSQMRVPYAELCALDPAKPVMVTEWGVGEFPNHGDKAAWITEAFSDLQKNYPRLRAAIYWHERWQNEQTFLYSNLKVNSSPGAHAAYRHGLASPFWLDRPQFR